MHLFIHVIDGTAAPERKITTKTPDTNVIFQVLKTEVNIPALSLGIHCI